MLKRARAGDELAFEELFSRYQRGLYRYALHMCGAATADDIVQDTFLAVLKAGAGFDEHRGTAGAYLFGIARHLVLKRLGSRYVGTTDGIDGIESRPAPDLSALDVLSRQETVLAVRSAIASLPPAFRETIVLCELEEMDYQTVAAVLACPIGTVRSRLHRARGLLADRLSLLRPVNQAS